MTEAILITWATIPVTLAAIAGIVKISGRGQKKIKMKKLLIILAALTIGGCIVAEPEPYYYYDDPYTYEYYYEEPEVIIVEEDYCYYTDAPYYYEPLACDAYGYCTWTEWVGEWYCYETYYYDELCGWEFYSEECI